MPATPGIPASSGGVSKPQPSSDNRTTIIGGGVLIGIVVLVVAFLGLSGGSKYDDSREAGYDWVSTQLDDPESTLSFGRYNTIPDEELQSACVNWAEEARVRLDHDYQGWYDGCLEASLDGRAAVS